jgi:hypothetical protein
MPHDPDMTSPSPCGRRGRQLCQIAALVAAGAHQRATGLALEHLACFPQDAERLVEAGAIIDRSTVSAEAGSNERKDPWPTQETATATM